MSNNSNGNGYTQKELLNMVIERLDRLEEKLDAKLDKAEFYKVLGLLVAVGGVVVAALMQEGGKMFDVLLLIIIFVGINWLAWYLISKEKIQNYV